MIQKLVVKRFKSIEDANLNLKKLNLFVGANSAGKSSAIQALMLALDNNDAGTIAVPCNMVHVRTSSFNELRSYILNAKSFEIQLNEINYEFTSRDDAMMQTMIRKTTNVGVKGVNLLYLLAMRNADLSRTSINSAPRLNPLGKNGEFVIDYYYNHRTDVLPPSLVFDKNLGTLDGQVNYWLNRLTGYSMQVSMLGSEYQVYFEDFTSKKLLSPIHVGTGISFIAELLIVCLAAKENDLIIIENPEIHLHPSAQAAIMDFLAMVAANGNSQIIVESHSDHLFNGIRRLLHNEKLKIGVVSVYNFKRDGRGITSAQEVQLSQMGGIKEYIPGMFDQFDEDLDAILK